MTDAMQEAIDTLLDYNIDVPALQEAAKTGVRCMEQRNEAWVEIEHLTRLVNEIAYTAKNRKKKMHRYRDTLRSIGKWTQETQDECEKAGLSSAICMWRGCVAEANMALERGGDAVEGREKVLPVQEKTNE